MQDKASQEFLKFVMSLVSSVYTGEAKIVSWGSWGNRMDGKTTMTVTWKEVDSEAVEDRQGDQ